MQDTPTYKNQVFTLGTQVFLDPLWLVTMILFGTHIFFILEFFDLLEKYVQNLCPTLSYLKQVIFENLLLDEFTKIFFKNFYFFKRLYLRPTLSLMAF